MCAPCYVRVRYLAGTPVECKRCARVRLPFSKGLCKSCYQVLRRQPDASLQWSTTHRERISKGSIGLHKGKLSGKWQGGRFLDAGGYVRVVPPEGYKGVVVHDGRYVSEHRIVAERTLGRLLIPGEIVHHINRDRTDNRPENLMVLPSVSAHRRLHVSERKQRDEQR